MRSKFSSIVGEIAPAAKRKGGQKTAAAPPVPAGGKRTDPRYHQMNAYVLIETHTQVKASLLLQGSGRDTSDLIEELMSRWLEAKAPARFRVVSE